MTETEGTATEESAGHNADTAQAPSSGQSRERAPQRQRHRNLPPGTGAKRKACTGGTDSHGHRPDLPRRTTRSAAGWGRRHIRRAGLRRHVAPAALERLREIRGEGTPAIVLAVYGNRSFGTAVAELASFVAGRGIRARSGRGIRRRAFVQHARNPDRTGTPRRTGSGRRHGIRGAGTRKDSDDTTCPRQGPGNSIRHRSNHPGNPSRHRGYSQGPRNGRPCPHRPAKLREPRTPLLPKLRFIRFVLGYRRRQKRNPVVLLPEGDAARCTQCGRCVALCPTQAIARGDELHTDPARCIRCCACVKGCAFGARTFRTPFAAALARNFARRKPPVTLL